MHSHSHSHPHPAPRQAGRNQDRRRLLVALGLTFVILAVEVVGGYLSGSLALLSDAGHVLTDASALGLALLALWFSGRPATVKKTYGYYRLEILSALANGVLLIVLTGFILTEAYHRFRSPAPIHLRELFWVALLGLVVNLVTLAYLHRSHSLNVRSAFLHVLGDTLSSVGVVVGAVVMGLTGWLWVDPLISTLISFVIVAGAWRLVRDAVDILLEATPAHVDMAAVRHLMERVEGVSAVHDLHVWTITSGIYALSAHLVVADPMVCNNDQILSSVKHELFDQFGIDHTTIQIESESFAHLGEVH